MAAGRHGGYRDNEMNEVAYSRGEYDRIRNGNRDYERGRVRQKDIKERELNNDGYRSASSRSDSGSSGSGSSGGGGGKRRSGYSVRDVDREPGELSSESGSDEGTDTQSRVRDEDVSMLENGESKKRKFSPIVWDREDKEVNKLSKSRMAPEITALPPPPPLPKSFVQSPNNISDDTVQISRVENVQIKISESSLVMPRQDDESAVDLSSSPVLVQHVDYHEEIEQREYEYSAPMRNIRASRWADEANSSADEGDISDIVADNGTRRSKKTSLSASVEMRARKKSVSPEFGELKRVGSEGTRARQSESDEDGFRVGSSNRDDYPDNDLEKNEYMEIDVEHNSNGTSGSQSDADSEDEHDSRDTLDPSAPPQRSVNMLQGCRSVDEFERLNKIDEGTYGVVYRAQDKKTGEIVALKKVKMEKEREGFPLTSLREINILLSFHHPSIVDVKEVVVGSSLDSIFMAMEYMEHDLKGLMETMKQPFSQSEVKCLMIQLLEGVKYLHDNWVLHRDLKTSNLLLNNRGELKICDFGMARQYGSPLKPYTHLVVTLWYRAPELLLGAKLYSTAIDMWSLGCIMAELLTKQPLFNGKTEFDQLDKIFKILGTPNESIWPGFSKLPGVKVNFVKHQYNVLRRKFPVTSFTGSPVLSDAGFDLLSKLLTYDPEKRITAEAALRHEWFREVPLPKSKDFMPTFPAQHAQDRRMRRIMKSPDPLEEQRRKELQQGELGSGGLFG